MVGAKGSSKSSARTVLDLTLSDSDDDSDLEVISKPPTSTFAPAGKGKSTKLTEEEDASLVLARQLPAEWDQAEQEAQVSHVLASSSKHQSAPSKTADAEFVPGADMSDSDPRTILVAHRKLLVGSRKCKCSTKVSAPTSKPKLSAKSTLTVFSTLATLTCPSCKVKICRGCGEPSKDGSRCCSAGRLTLILEILGALDTVYLDGDRLRKPLDAADRPKAKKSRGGAATGKGKGTGFASDSRYYGGGGQQVLQYAAPFENRKDVAQDQIFTVALQLLAQLLPSSASEEIFDIFPHESLPSLLIISTLGDLLSNLLRNDSTAEWLRRSPVYYAALDVRSFEARQAWVEGGVLAWLLGDGEIVWEREAAEVKPKKDRKKRAASPEVEGELVFAVPLYTLIKRLVTQADTLRSASTTGEIEDDDIQLISICSDFSSLNDQLAAGEQLWKQHARQEGIVQGGLGGQGVGKVATEGWSEKDFNKATDALSFASIDLGAPTYATHYYSKTIQAAGTSRSFMRAAREIALLSTSLPTGIYLRVDEARIDVIKCLIAGPPDSGPYSEGLFEFNIHLAGFPQTAPTVSLRTTGGGRVRFNPNLYAEGKVCLSLLGTWPGSPEEMWQPNKSTLLGVLVSIQGFILGTHYPYFNEPGYGAPTNSATNKKYNANCSLAVVRHAILAWMEPDKQAGIWGDVIAMHFKMPYKIIKEQIAAWAAADPRLRAWLPQYDSLAGTAAAATYKPPPTNGYGSTAAAYLQNMPFGAVGMGAAMPWAGQLGGAAGYGGGPMQAFNSAGQPLGPAPAPPTWQ